MNTTNPWDQYWGKLLPLVRECYAKWRDDVAHETAKDLRILRRKIRTAANPQRREQLKEELRGKNSKLVNAPPWQIVNIFSSYDSKHSKFELDKFLECVLNRWLETSDDWEEGGSNHAADGAEAEPWEVAQADDTRFVLSVVLALLVLDEKKPHASLRLKWPPPRKIFRRLLVVSRRLLRTPVPSSAGSGKHGSKRDALKVVNADGIQYLRIPEIVLYCLVSKAIKKKPEKSPDGSWPDKAWSDYGWGRRVLEAWRKLVDYVRESVDVALLHIESREPRFKRRLNRQRYARELMQELMGEECQCTCVLGAEKRFRDKRIREKYVRIVHERFPSTDDRDALTRDGREVIYEEAIDAVEEKLKAGSGNNGLRRNIKVKTETCKTKHRLHRWAVKEETLWKFLQTAAKGNPGKFKVKGFESSMLRQRLWKAYPELELAAVALHHCPRCGHDTVISGGCPACGLGFDESIVRVRSADYWIWNNDLVNTQIPNRCFELVPYHRCSGPARGLSGHALKSLVNGKIRASDVPQWTKLATAILRGKSKPRSQLAGCIWLLLPASTRTYLPKLQRGAKIQKADILTGLNHLLALERLWKESAFVNEPVNTWLSASLLGESATRSRAKALIGTDQIPRR